MKKLLIILVFFGVCNEAMALSIPWQTISGSRTSNHFSWNYSYDIGFFNETLMIDLDIRLVGDAVDQSLLNRWEYGIENIWSTDRFAIPILFNVDWVSENFDTTVHVHDRSTGTFNMTNWNTRNANGWGDAYQEEIVAHEARHMFGLWDEYTGGAVDPDTGLINTGGLMHTLNGPTLDPYYAVMLGWYDKFKPVPDVVPPAGAVPIPAPATVWLFCLGLLGMVAARWHKSRYSVLPAW